MHVCDTRKGILFEVYVGEGNKSAKVVRKGRTVTEEGVEGQTRWERINIVKIVCL